MLDSLFICLILTMNIMWMIYSHTTSVRWYPNETVYKILVLFNVFSLAVVTYYWSLGFLVDNPTFIWKPLAVHCIAITAVYFYPLLKHATPTVVATGVCFINLALGILLLFSPIVEQI